MKFKQDLILQLIDLCNNNTPVSLKSLLNTIETDKEYTLLTRNINSHIYSSSCSLELYEACELDICAINFSLIVIGERWENKKYHIFFSRTDLIKIDTYENGINNTITDSNLKFNVDANKDEVYIACITKEDDNDNIRFQDIANINITQSPGEEKWKYIKRKEFSDVI